MLKYVLVSLAILALPSQAFGYEYSKRIDSTAVYKSSTTTESFLRSMVKSKAYNEADKHCTSLGYYGTERQTINYGYFRITKIKGGARIEVDYDFICRKFGKK